GVDCTIIMNPKTWVASGHVGGFNDPMVDCKESKQRYRADHLAVLGSTAAGARLYAFIENDDEQRAAATKALMKYERRDALDPAVHVLRSFTAMSAEDRARIIGPHAKEPGTLTEPRQFNLMFETNCGAVKDENSLAYLRPETAQGIFVNFWNIVDSSRVRVPFGIAQIGKSFRNEVTPRNFTFRSREFEQMEIEFFIRPETANEWYTWWRDWRFSWWQKIGLAGANLQLREHDRDELAHYAKEGAGTSDIEYRFPFTAPGFGELEGVAHRADFDLKAHATHCGKGEKMRYFDQEKNERYFPHVIEPSAGADRGTLALLCEAYTPDPSRASGVYMNFTPRMAPVKAGVFPLVNKDGLPEIAERLYRDLRRKHNVEFDEKQSIGKRYARMDEAGTPFCITIDHDGAANGTATIRHRDTQAQDRVAIDQISAWVDERVG
ncbi:MAG: glycyl-tRNA synthetase, partial [Planctomycetota bacterium]